MPPRKLKPLQLGTSKLIGRSDQREHEPDERRQADDRGRAPSSPTGYWRPVCSCRRFAQMSEGDRGDDAGNERDRHEPGVAAPSIGFGMKRPRCVEEESSPANRPTGAGCGSEVSTAMYQKQSCSSSGMLRITST